MELRNVTDATKLERIRRKLVALRQYFFFTYDLVTDVDYLKFVKLLKLYVRRFQPVTLFFISVYSGSKCYRLSSILQEFEFLLVNLEIIFSLLLLADTPVLLDAFRPSIMCAKTLVSLGKLLLH
jgi:hypothetical protein